MKLKIFSYFFLICLLAFIAACTTEPEGATESAEPFDFSGTWIANDYWTGCGGTGKDTRIIKITHQPNDDITLVVEESNHVYNGYQDGNIINLDGIKYANSRGGNIIADDYELTMSENRKTLSGLMTWTWDTYDCLGETATKAVRKGEM